MLLARDLQLTLELGYDSVLGGFVTCQARLYRHGADEVSRAPAGGPVRTAGMPDRARVGEIEDNEGSRLRAPRHWAGGDPAAGADGAVVSAGDERGAERPPGVRQQGSGSGTCCTTSASTGSPAVSQECRRAPADVHPRPAAEDQEDRYVRPRRSRRALLCLDPVQAGGIPGSRGGDDSSHEGLRALLREVGVTLQA